ncbi:response regulator [candidate division WOR-3 bacterium]|nr:response regulator [candidate division WOR-3 bacterium]
MVEDNAGDGELLLDFLEQSKVRNHIHWVKDGEAAMAFLHREGGFADKPLPDLILLDLNLPRKDGREVLAEVKADPEFHNIPVVVLTSSNAESDIAKSYSLKANCYVIKPVDLNQFMAVVKSIENFWLTVVRLPTHEGGGRA